ncbi:hypothetical protein D3C87_829380 [compost metagenome]
MNLKYSNRLELFVHQSDGRPVSLDLSKLGEPNQASLRDSVRTYKVDGLELICERTREGNWQLSEAINGKGFITGEFVVTEDMQLHAAIRGSDV